jgi:signal peptidase II
MQAAGGATLNADEAAGSARSGSPSGSAATAGARGYSPAALGVLGLTAALAVTLDQVVKALATHHLSAGEPVRVLGGLIYLSLLRNGGAAFSLGSGYTWVFPLITVAVITWIVWMGRRLRSVPWAVALGLVLGGALGNLADRLFRAPGPFRGHVVDMISLLTPYGQGFAIFNIADSCLTIGVILAVLLELTGRQRDGSRVRPASKERAA